MFAIRKCENNAQNALAVSVRTSVCMNSQKICCIGLGGAGAFMIRVIPGEKFENPGWPTLPIGRHPGCMGSVPWLGL